MSYKRTDDLLFLTGIDKGMSNIMLEGDNEGEEENGESSREERVANANKREDLEP